MLPWPNPPPLKGKKIRRNQMKRRMCHFNKQYTINHQLMGLHHVMQQLFLKGFFGNVALAQARANNIVGDAINNIRTIFAFNAEDKVVKWFSQELEVPLRRSLIRGHVNGKPCSNELKLVNIFLPLNICIETNISKPIIL